MESFISTSSQMLKHAIEEHKGEEISELKFKMKCIRVHRSAFERQVHKGVRIQRERKYRMNSKSKFNGCALPRLALKLGNSKMKEKKKS